MKTLFTIVLLLGAAVSASADTKAYDYAKRAKLIEWVEQLRVKAEAATTAARQSQAALTLAQVELVSLQGQIQALHEDFVLTVGQRDKLSAELAEESAKRTVLLAKYHKLKFWVSALAGAIAAGAVGLLILRFGGLALNTVPGAAVAFGAPLVVFGVVYGAMQILW